MSKTQRREQSGQNQPQRNKDHQRPSSLMTNYQRVAPLGQPRGCTTEARMGQPAPEQQQQQQQQQQHPCFFLPNDGITSMTTANIPPVPQTPFDPSYGASLLPSHMLMGSPFLSTPIRPQGPFHSSLQGHNNHSMHHSSSTRSSYIYYPQPPILKPIPPRKKKSVALKHDEPYEINFKILPKGRDEYMTRSLLFTNLEMEPSIDIHKFLADFIKYGPIESLFLLDDNHSILLSFLTKNVCLDFYNNLLQKFSEFKSKLHSPKLSVSFVCQDEASWFKSLQINVVTRGATRSIYVEFDNQELDLSPEFVRETFPWLFSSQRYVVERIDIVRDAKPNQNFAKNYILIHYICISMALEVDDYLQHPNQKKQFGIVRVQFVNASGHSSDIFEDETVVTTNTYQSDSRTSSVSSLSLPISNSSEHAELFHSLNVTLDTISLQVIPSEYPTPEIVLHDEHLNSVTISKPSKSLASSNSLAEMDASLSTGASQHGSNGVPGGLMLNDHSSSSNTPAILPSELNVSTPIMAGSISNQMMGGGPPLSMQNVNDPKVSSPAFFMDPMSTAPITETLQRQYLMGATQLNGVNNRTVYIGNIHPRSKPEDICNVVRGGILQNIKWIQSKRICFVTFIEMAAAVQFYANATLEPIVLHGNVLRVGWGQPSGELPKNIALAVTVGASRNVYVSLPEYSFKEKYINNPEFKLYHGKYSLPSEEQLRQDFTKYGQIEQINYLEDGHCCWVNFMNIAYAIRLVEDSNSSSERNLAKFHAQFNDRYRNLIIGYGKDRCGNVNRNLAANKNSKFFKKAKKQNHNKLNKPQSLSEGSPAALADDVIQKNVDSTSKNSELSKEANFDELLNGTAGNELSEGLGISLAAVHVSDESHGNKKIQSELVSNEKGSKTNKAKKDVNCTSIGDALTTNVTNKMEEEDEEEEAGYSTSGSSDIDIIVAPPANNKKTDSVASVHGKPKKKTRSNLHKPQNGDCLNIHYNQLYSLSSYAPVVSNGALETDSSLALLNGNRESCEKKPRSASVQSPVEPHVATFNNNYNYNGHESLGSNGTKSRRKRRAKYSKPIAGQDVMNQYLEHLHHSTLQYATNILGATTVHEPLGGYCDLNSNEH